MICQAAVNKPVACFCALSFIFLSSCSSRKLPFEERKNTRRGLGKLPVYSQSERLILHNHVSRGRVVRK